MKHLGDITKINGAEAPVVNVIIGGSPCQDLSLAGKRKGLTGERSGLFMEQLRIIKEMREADEARGRTDEHIRPRFMVWENVPGAFSTNGGKDFGAVLHETVKIACHNAPPVPMSGNKWAKSGCLVDVDGKWSIAWRVFDAQFWGVPQRRRRIALVADFGGLAAPEILFERKSVSRNFEESETAWKRTATDFEKRTEWQAFGTQSGAEIRTDDKAPTLTAAAGMSGNNQPVICIQGNCIDRAETAGCNGKAPDLRAQSGDNQPAIALENHANDSRVKIAEDGIVQTLSGRMGTGGGNTPLIYENHVPCSWDGGQTSPTLTKSNAGGQQRMPDSGNFNAVIALDRASFNQGKNAQYDFEVSESGINSSLVARGPSGVCSQEKSECERYIVRRLTPLECERLQGFPDGWTDIGEWTDSKGKLHKESSDSARYAALGNSIALPSWFYVLSKLSEFCEEKTMASLFDGIGGFPLIWETLNGKGSCLWASEIEEFPIAVTKHHFPDEEKEK